MFLHCSLLAILASRIKLSFANLDMRICSWSGIHFGCQPKRDTAYQ